MVITSHKFRLFRLLNRPLLCKEIKGGSYEYLVVFSLFLIIDYLLFIQNISPILIG